MVNECPNIPSTAVYNPSEAAIILGVSRQTIYNAMESGALRHRFTRDGYRRIVGAWIKMYWNRKN